MDKTLLVGPDLETGRRILKALDEADIKISVALWGFLSQYEDWRLILASRQLDTAGIGGAYSLVFKTLKKAGFTVEDTDPIMVVRMKDKFIRELRQIFGKTQRVEGMRLGNQLIGDRFLEQGYAYRIT
jgi:hypothetical protein